jgi:RNA polymerase sigma factor (sigma-70 family)
MKKYNIRNYVRYKDDVKASINLIEFKAFQDYTRDELIVTFLPLVENIARKFSTSDQASGVMDITDLIQDGSLGLIRAVDKIIWETVTESDDPEKTLKSFLSKRIKGSIRRAIDINRGDIRIPEHKLNEIRNNPEDKKAVALFFNSIFLSIDSIASNDDDIDGDTWANSIEDKSEDYNIHLLNIYLSSLMRKYLNIKEYEVLRLSYGLDCPKHSAKEIADKLNIKGARDYVTVSELKKQAVQTLIDNVDHTQVLDYL